MFYEHEGERISVIPSLIHYGEGRTQWVGNQVLERNLLESERTFRWMKRYIANQSPIKRKFDGREVSYFDAGRDFLAPVLTFAMAELGITGDEEVAFTLPVEGFEHFEDWVATVVEEVGIRRYRFIDEPSAAALGHGAHIQPGDVYLVLDFGAGTLDVSMVLIEPEGEVARTGRRCRVLGKAGAELGGMKIDQWLFEEVLKTNGLSDYDEVVRKLSREGEDQALLSGAGGGERARSRHGRSAGGGVHKGPI